MVAMDSSEDTKFWKPWGQWHTLLWNPPRPRQRDKFIPATHNEAQSAQTMYVYFPLLEMLRSQCFWFQSFSDLRAFAQMLLVKQSETQNASKMKDFQFFWIRDTECIS